MRFVGTRGLMIGAVGMAGLVLAGFAPGPSAWASGSTVVTGGYDISWPQCPSSLPSGQIFGVVGVNDGKPNTQNPCLTTEYKWAESSSSYAPQLYLNSANPGRSSYPIGQTQPQVCTRKDTTGCAYDYGYDAAINAFGYLNQPPTTLDGLQWWIDVETANTWQHDATSNIQDIQGMIDGLKSQGVTTQLGVYTNASSWRTITSNTRDFSSDPAWFPTGLNYATTTDDWCGQSGPSGGLIWMVQYYTSQGSTSYDGDDLCPAYAG